MSTRRTIRSIALALLPLLATGCGSLGGTITAMPADWAGYDGHTVTVRGTAGNMRQGPIVRFDNGYVALRAREPWMVDVVGRPVEVTGKIVSGQDFRAEPYILDATSITRLPQSAPPPPDADAKAAR